MNNIGAMKNEVKHSNDKVIINILNKISEINNGKVTLIIQDGLLIQYNICKKCEAVAVEYNDENIIYLPRNLEYIKTVIKEVIFGQVIITVKNGKLVEIEQEEKFRVK